MPAEEQLPTSHNEALARALRAVSGDGVPHQEPQQPEPVPTPQQPPQGATEPSPQQLMQQQGKQEQEGVAELAQKLIDANQKLVEYQQQIKAVQSGNYVSMDQLRQQIQADPATALQQLGYDPSSLLDLALAVNQPDQEQKPAVDPLEEIRERLNKFEQRTTQTLQHQQQVTEMNRIRQHVDINKEKYPWVNALADDGSIGQAYEYMVQLYNNRAQSALPGQKPPIPTYDEFLPALEETLSSTAKRWNEMYGSLTPQQQAQQQQAASLQQPPAQPQNSLPTGLQETPNQTKMTKEEKYKRALALALGNNA